jgi:sugar phosphate isomerase/epimerase
MSRFALNSATTKRWPLPQLLEGCLAQGVTRVGLWREDLHEHGAATVRSSGITVTSLCRGGFFTNPDWWDDNRRAIDEAHSVGAGVLVLVSGGLPRDSRDIDAARAHVGDAVGRLVPHALDAGVTLAIEPLHPMYASDRCVVSTLGQALSLAAPYPAEAVGVCVDTYHLWWDPDVWDQIKRAGAENRIAAFQVADWVTPLPEGVLLGRGLPGTGCVELRRFREAVDATGFTGPIEVEIFNETLWSRPGPDVLRETLTSFHAHVG